jgi:hypothetical protein
MATKRLIGTGEDAHSLSPAFAESEIFEEQATPDLDPLASAGDKRESRFQEALQLGSSSYLGSSGPEILEPESLSTADRAISTSFGSKIQSSKASAGRRCAAKDSEDQSDLEAIPFGCNL